MRLEFTKSRQSFCQSIGEDADAVFSTFCEVAVWAVPSRHIRRSLRSCGCSAEQTVATGIILNGPAGASYR